MATEPDPDGILAIAERDRAWRPAKPRPGAPIGGRAGRDRRILLRIVDVQAENMRKLEAAHLELAEKNRRLARDVAELEARLATTEVANVEKLLERVKAMTEALDIIGQHVDVVLGRVPPDWGPERG